MAKILLLSDIFPPKTGGSGRWFWEIYSRLPREQVYVAAGDGPGAADLDATHAMGVTRLPIEMATRGLRPLGNLKHYLRLASQVRRLAKQQGITAIHAGRNLPEGFVAYLVRRRSGYRYLCYAHGEDIGVAGTSRELAWMTRRVFAGASLVIANSQNTLRMLHEEWRVPEIKTRLLYPGVDTTRFVPASPDAEFRRAMGWTDRQVLLTVGRLQKRKGHDMLIRALPAIRAKCPRVLYAIIGHGEERPTLERLAKEHNVADAVQFLGEIDDARLRQCYQQCDLFVLPNRAVGRDIEGFGMVLLEAQACGTPVLAGASGGTDETMNIPDTGRVVLCDAPAPLAQAVVDLLADEAALRAMGGRGRKWVCGRFDWQALAEEARQLFAG